jgi:hypothetical protein
VRPLMTEYEAQRSDAQRFDSSSPYLAGVSVDVPFVLTVHCDRTPRNSSCEPPFRRPTTALPIVSSATEQSITTSIGRR